MRTLSVLLVCLVCLTGTSAFAGELVYSSIPSTLPGNYPSLGYQATATAEAGDAVALAGSSRQLESVMVGMSSWALKSTPANQGIGDDNGFYHDMTLNIYAMVGLPTAADLLATKTISAWIPYRPAVFGYNGIAFTIDFDFTNSIVILPEQVIVTLAFNTQTWGANPLGVDGPWNSLNLGVPTGGTYVGTDLNNDQIFWNTRHAPFYTDKGAGGVGILRSDTAWTGNTPAFSITTATPEPGTVMLAGLALAGLAVVRRRR